MLVPCLSILDTLPLDSPSILGAHSSRNHTLGQASFTGLPPRHLPGDPVSEGPMLGLMSCSGHLEIINNFILGLVSCKWSRWDTSMCMSRGDAPGSGMRTSATCSDRCVLLAAGPRLTQQLAWLPRAYRCLAQSTALQNPGKIVLGPGSRLEVATVVAAAEGAALATVAAASGEHGGRIWRRNRSLYIIMLWLNNVSIASSHFMSNKMFLKENFYSFTFLTVLLFLFFELRNPIFILPWTPQIL